jgi:NADH dehydrogenase FAD-containing subunit
MIQEKNIVIVGGGFAGVETANVLEKELTRSNDSQYRIILIEKVRYHKANIPHTTNQYQYQYQYQY